MKYLTLLLFVLLSTTVIAQVSASLNYVKIDYDAAGNRIKRSIVIQDDQEVVISGTQNEIKEEINAKVYPNPFADKLNIEFTNTKEQTYDARIIDINGKLIMSMVLNSGINTIDLNWLSPGEYMVCVDVNGNAKTWKVSKL